VLADHMRSEWGLINVASKILILFRSEWEGKVRLLRDRFFPPQPMHLNTTANERVDAKIPSQ
jgi:hypothetical protein